MGQHLSPRYGQVILVSGYPVLTAVNWSQHWCAICVQYQSSCAPKLARKCEIEHWLPCGADGRAGGRCTVTWLPNFLGWVDLLTHGAPQARFARQSSANISYKTSLLRAYFQLFWHNPHPDTHRLWVQKVSKRENLSLVKCFAEDIRFAFATRPSNWHHTNGT